MVTPDCSSAPLLISMLGWFVWNPKRELFTVPVINHPVMWYGFFFVSGLFIGYLIMRSLLQAYLQQKEGMTREQATETATSLTDRMTWFVIAGGIIGARLGHVFFYNWPTFKNHLFDIVKIWEGGLASHGGAIGAILGLVLYRLWIAKSHPKLSLLRIIDLVCIPTALVAVFIRVGNFFNQEILGTYSTMPWAIIFARPADGTAPYPRHPVQLYEAFAYLITFMILVAAWRKYGFRLKEGVISGLFFLFVYGFRFCLEFFKSPQSLLIDESRITMGQYLSIPFILLGLCLLAYGLCRRNDCSLSSY